MTNYVKIPIHIVEALARTLLSPTESKLIWFIIRKTLGYHKKDDKIALSQFRGGCLITQNRQILRSLNSLVAKQLLYKGDKGFRLNQNIEQWAIAEKTLIAEKASRQLQSRHFVSCRAATHKKKLTKKNNIKQVLIVSDGLSSEPRQNKSNQDIDKILLACCNKLGIDDFASSNRMKRFYGKHLHNLMLKIGPNEMSRRIEILLLDSFKSKRLNDIAYLYRELKGFIEPRKRSNIIS